MEVILNLTLNILDRMGGQETSKEGFVSSSCSNEGVLLNKGRGVEYVGDSRDPYGRELCSEVFDCFSGSNGSLANSLALKTLFIM